jgi:putative SOS response-associated peptidase YedK
MCGRYVSATPAAQIAAYFGSTSPTTHLPASYNVAPTQDVYVVVAEDAGWRMEVFRWGFTPRWAKTGKPTPILINARAETLAEKPTFRASLRSRRCLIPADGFYEWRSNPVDPKRGRKQPFFIHHPDGDPYAFAGLWELQDTPGAEGTPSSSCVIVTTTPNAPMVPIHNRMPVILPPSAWDRWLDREQTEVQLLQDLLLPAAAEVVALHAVATGVNNARHDGPQLIAPVVDGMA